jgi:hypothetical protein
MLALEEANGVARAQSFRRFLHRCLHFRADRLPQWDGVFQARIIAATVERGREGEKGLAHLKLGLGGLGAGSAGRGQKQSAQDQQASGKLWKF